MHLRRLMCAALVFFSGEASTSQTHLRRPLVEVVSDSDLVVVAVPADPPTRVIPVDITPKGQTPDARKWPPYQRVLERFVVREVISDRARNGIIVPTGAPKLKPGVVIEVDNAEHGNNLWLHRSYYVDGMSESPIYESYAAEGTTASTAKILFLQWQKQGLQFSVLGGYEHVEHRALVDAALHAPTVPSITPVNAH